MALSYVEHIATALQTNFSITFPYLERSHVHVYLDDVETTAFTFNNSTTIQLTTGAAADTVVRLSRSTPIDEPLVDFSNGANLGESDLDSGVLQNLFSLQEWYEADAAVTPAGHTLDSHTDGLPGELTSKGTMRVYNEDGKWAGITAPTTGDVLIGDEVVPEGVRWFPKGTDGNFLQVDDAEDGKLSWVSGFKNLYTTLGDILYASAAGVASRLGIGTKGYSLVALPGSTPPVQWMPLFTTGDVKLTFKASADSGWVLMNDGSIGSASSGATLRANADTEDLYTLLWTNVTNAWAPVATGRGASAAADFAANKAMTLPRALGRALGIAGAGSSLTSRALGEYLGAEDAINVSHTHTVTDPGHYHTVVHDGAIGGAGGAAAPGDGSVGTPATINSSNVTTGLSVNTSGASGTGANMQPTTFLNVMIKL